MTACKHSRELNELTPQEPVGAIKADQKLKLDSAER